MLVWKQKVYDLISEERPAPYSIQPESMSTGDLRACATRPYRIRAALQKPHNMTLETQEVSILAMSETLDPSVQAFALDPHLLPGGRWLLGLMITKGAAPTIVTLACWDIRASFDGACFPIAELPSASDTISEWAQQATEDPMKVNILLSGIDQYGQGSIFFIRYASPKTYPPS